LSKLNDEYFKSKEVYKKNYKKRKLTKKQKAINIAITAVLLFFVHFIQKQCSQRIKENKKQYNLIHKNPAPTIHYNNEN